jgi:branched-chain amino acid transport system ATP-binding protein
MSGSSAGGAVPLLRVDGLTVRYGALTAVDAVHLSVPPGARHALIGPNGAGKSSLFATLAGAIRPTSGVIELDGHDVTAESEASRSRRGLVRTFQHSSLFVGLSVRENVRVAVERAEGSPLRPWPSLRRDRVLDSRADEHLVAVGLSGRSEQLVASLSHGERRQLEVALVLACNPRLVLFDEPTAGMSAAETHRFAELVESLPRSLTLLIVEHDLDVVYRLAERISVLAAGRLLAEGTPDQIRANEAVNEAYLRTGRGEEPLFTDTGHGPGGSYTRDEA